MRFTSYSGSTPPSGIASGLASLPNGLPSTPPGSVTCLVWTSYCSPLVTPLFFYLVVFRRRAHGPFVHCLAVTVAVRTDHVPNVYIVALVRYLALISTSCHYGLGKPYFVFFTNTNITCHYGLAFRVSDLVSTPCALPPPMSFSPPPLLISLCRVEPRLRDIRSRSSRPTLPDTPGYFGSVYKSLAPAV